MNPKAWLPIRTNPGLLSALRTTFLIGAAVSYPLHAGLVTVNNVDPGTNVTFSYTDPSTGKTVTKTVPGLPANSKTAVTVELGLGSLANEKAIGSIFITKTAFGGIATAPYEIMLNPSGKTLASLEPFDIPTLVDSGVPLVAVVDIAALLAQGDPFTSGEAISVLNGMTLATSAIVFEDGSSLGPNPVLTAANVGSLPTFTGSATVYGFDSVTPTPEPSYTCLLLAALSVLTGRVLVRQRKTQKSRESSAAAVSQLDDLVRNGLTAIIGKLPQVATLTQYAAAVRS